MKNYKPNFIDNSQINSNYINQDDLWDMVNDQIIVYLSSPSSHFEIEKARNEKWLGSTHSKKDSVGLLGYMRNNIAFQIKILNQYSNHIPLWFGEFASFFKSDHFKNRVLQEQMVSFKIHPTLLNNQRIDYLEIIKKKLIS